MTRKKTRRKHCQADEKSWVYAIAGNWDMDAKVAAEIMQTIRIAFERLKSGQGEDADFDWVALNLNLGLIRAEAIHQDAVDCMLAGINALVNGDRIQKKHGRFGFTGPDLLGMGDALDLYEQILTKSTPRQMQAATLEAQRRMRAGAVLEL